MVKLCPARHHSAGSFLNVIEKTIRVPPGPRSRPFQLSFRNGRRRVSWAAGWGDDWHVARVGLWRRFLDARIDTRRWLQNASIALELVAETARWCLGNRQTFFVFGWRSRLDFLGHRPRRVTRLRRDLGMADMRENPAANALAISKHCIRNSDPERWFAPRLGVLSILRTVMVGRTPPRKLSSVVARAGTVWVGLTPPAIS